jgi:hypothetical protein
MYPLLVSGIASVATNLIDNWSRASERKAETEFVKFQEVLDRVVGPAKKAGASGVGKAVNPLEARIAELRAALLDSPEVRGLVETGDPTKPAALQLGADGQLVVQTPNGWPRTLALSGDAKSHAQELVQLLASRPAVTGTAPAMSFSR